MRRIRRRKSEFNTIVATGSATYLDSVVVPSDALVHHSSLHFDTSGRKILEGYSDHLDLFSRTHEVYGSGSTGVKLTAHAAGAQFHSLSSAVDHRFLPGTSCGRSLPLRIQTSRYPVSGFYSLSLSGL